MPTKEGFTPDHPLPLFLSEHADIPSRILKTGILVVAVTAIGFAIVSLGNPVALFTNVTASLVDLPALQPGTGQSTPTIQSTADAQALPPTARDAPMREEIAAPFEPANRTQTEISQPPAEALLKQFQAWATKEDVPAQVVPVQPVQDAPALVQDAQPQVRSIQKNRQVRPVQNARAEIRSARNPQAKVRREQSARVQVRSAHDGPAQDQSVPNTQAPSFLQRFGWRN